MNDNLKNKENDIDKIMKYFNVMPEVLEYRRRYFEVFDKKPLYPAIPNTRAWPKPDDGVSYRDKLIKCLNISGTGAEIGPLNIPQLTKSDANVLYVDHLSTSDLRIKYPSMVNESLVDIDRPMEGRNLRDTLIDDAPLDFVVASQVMEHVPDPIEWLSEISDVLKIGGRLAISLPDRRHTFDLYRYESRPSDFVLSNIMKAQVPDVRSVYDHFSGVAAVNMKWALENSVYPHEVIDGFGAVTAPKFDTDVKSLVEDAKNGKYHDVHAWVFTSVSFILKFSYFAREGMLPYRCYQFYPTNSLSTDRGNGSLTCVLEKVDNDSDPNELSRSFLYALD